MASFLSILSAPLRVPLKLVGAGVLVGAGAVAFGDYGTSIRSTVSQWVGLSSWLDEDAFDPGLVGNPDKELDFLRQVRDQLEPKVGRAKALIRKHQAEISYLRELTKFVERRIPQAELALWNADATPVAKLTASADTENPSPELRTWLGYQERIGALQDSLANLAGLIGRVDALNNRLDSRREQTLGLVSDDQLPSGERRPRVQVAPELAEAEQLLSDAHETLFKALHALDPELVR